MKQDFYVVKRDGSKVPFDPEKIFNAIFSAVKSVGGSDESACHSLVNKVEYNITINYEGKSEIDVETIQDIVEKQLIESGHAQVAKAYILYREQRSKNRQAKTNIIKTMDELTNSSAKDSDTKRENANINGDTAMGTMLKYGSCTAKEYYEQYVLNPAHAKAHKSGDIHIHDLDFYTLTTTCTQIDLKKLFTNGFSTGHGFLREPQDITSYAALACIAIQSNQNDQHGGQSVPKLDYDLADGVRKTYKKFFIKEFAKQVHCTTHSNADSYMETYEEIKKSLYEVHIRIGESVHGLQLIVHLSVSGLKSCQLITREKSDELVNKALTLALIETERATYQAMEALVHNLNTMHSRAGAQVPFSSVNYGTDTSPEGRMIIKNILLALEAGLGNGETPIFPIHIFKVKDGVNYKEGDPNYDLFKLACKVTAKRLFPNFSFLDAPFNAQYYKEGNPDTEIAYMGCRTRVIGNNFDPEREIVTGRGNLSFTSINLPRIAIESKGDVQKFFDTLKEREEMVFEQLTERFKIQSAKKVRNYPFLMEQGVWIDSDRLSLDDEVGEVLKHGSLTVGFIGLAECLKALVGVHHGEDENAQKLGLKIIEFMRALADMKSEETGLNYTVIATPAEGLSGRFVKIDRKKYGKIEGVTDREYYTNSFHVPVYYPISAFDKIKLEAPYHALTNGGHITYIELDGDPTKNVSTIEKIVKCMKDSGVGYGAINHPVDRDPLCGYNGIIYDECPKCGRKDYNSDLKFERIRRITGYLVGTLDRFNDGKRAEESDRVKHTI